MSGRPRSTRDEPSPNRRAKQDQIVTTAMGVLAERGLAGATAREIAAAGGLTRSVLHYYFADMDVLVDRAMAEHVANLERNLRASSPRATDPVRRFWATIDDYLATFRTHPFVAQLWFEYWVHATRTDRLDAVRAMHARISALLAERLADAGRSDAARVAPGLFSYLVGTIVVQTVNPPTRAALRADISALTGIPT